MIPIYIINKRISIYPYEVNKNYEYDFKQTKAEIINLNLKNGKTNLASKKFNKNYTAFLKVNVDAKIMGNFFQPTISIKVGKECFTQNVEHGAKGIRYLNITPVNLSDEEDLLIEGEYVSFMTKRFNLSFLKTTAYTIQFFLLKFLNI